MCCRENVENNFTTTQHNKMCQKGNKSDYHKVACRPIQESMYRLYSDMQTKQYEAAIQHSITYQSLRQ